MEFCVAGILLFQLCINVPENIYGYVNVWYVLDYSYGFGTRLMLGSILHLFLGGFISAHAAAVFVTASLIVLCILVALLAGACFRRARTPNEKRAVAFFTALYLASPAAPPYLWTPENFGRLDTWLFIAAILLVLVFLKVRRFVLRCILYFAIALLALAIHQIYIFLFFPSLCVLLLEEWIRGKYEKRRMIATLVVFFGLCAAFLYMQFFSGIYYDDLAALTTELQRHTDFPVSVPTLEAEYFWTLRDHFVRNQLPELRERVRFGILTILLLSPMWLCIVRLWRDALRQSHAGAEKRTRVLMLLTNIAFLPVFALMTDWGRWFAALLAVQYLNLAALIGGGDESVCAAAENAGGRIDRRPILYAALLLYCSLFEKFEAANYVDQVQAFYYWTWRIRTFFAH